MKTKQNKNYINLEKSALRISIAVLCLLMVAPLHNQAQSLKKVYSSPLSGYSTYLNNDLNAQMDQVNDPGISVSVLRLGQTKTRNMKGQSFETNEKRLMRANTLYYLASVTKPMTAQLVGQLVQLNRFKLTDKIAKYLPDVPAYMNSVKIGQLLNHSSGIPDYYQFINFRESLIDNQFVLELLGSKSKSLDYTPGSKFNYSNSNYILLAMLVEKVTGEKFANLMKLHVFDQFNMRDSHISPRAGKDYAKGYIYKQGQFLLNDFERREFEGGFIAKFNKKTYGASGAFSTIRDMESWLLHLGKDSYFDNLIGTAMPIQDESSEFIDNVRYKAGWYMGEIDGKTIYWHSGEFAGYRNMALYIPTHEFGLISLSNNGKFDAEGSGLKWAKRFLSKQKLSN